MTGTTLFAIGALIGLCAGVALAWCVRPLWDAHHQPDPYDGGAGG